MALENTKVVREQGGDRLTVKSGGEIRIETGGKIVPNSGTQASHIADPAAMAALTSAAITENGGAIGGTNDGNMPALVDPSGDAGASVIAAIRELAVALNEVRADVAAGKTAIDGNKAAIDAALVVLENAGLVASS